VQVAKLSRFILRSLRHERLADGVDATQAQHLAEQLDTGIVGAEIAFDTRITPARMVGDEFHRVLVSPFVALRAAYALALQS